MALEPCTLHPAFCPHPHLARAVPTSSRLKAAQVTRRTVVQSPPSDGAPQKNTSESAPGPGVGEGSAGPESLGRRAERASAICEGLLGPPLWLGQLLGTQRSFCGMDRVLSGLVPRQESPPEEHLAPAQPVGADPPLATERSHAEAFRPCFLHFTIYAQIVTREIY